uniref:Uncharacterized protein n=1 Tax=Arundo donax TaxID=35708 RepID=A0A0A9HNE7_ARUDO
MKVKRCGPDGKF